MKIIADENIAGLREFFSAYGEVLALPGRQINAKQLENADALLLRSVTVVNSSLLQNTPIKFVGSCTIGIDHLDTQWLEKQGIRWAHAPGCNAQAVVDYVLASLLALDINFSNHLIGIVGCGNVGGLLNKTLKSLGAETLCCDPFLPDTAEQDYLPLDVLISQCDVLCLHTPLTTSGEYPTFHLINNKNLALLKENVVLLNAGRGAVIDNNALLMQLNANSKIKTVLDVWEDEPSISAELLKQVTIGTPHIAGYSQAGKWRGTLMIHQAFCDAFSLTPAKDFHFPSSMLVMNTDKKPNRELILGNYDPRNDSNHLKKSVGYSPSERGEFFDGLRKNYAHRKEFVFFNDV